MKYSKDKFRSDFFIACIPILFILTFNCLVFLKSSKYSTSYLLSSFLFCICFHFGKKIFLSAFLFFVACFLLYFGTSVGNIISNLGTDSLIEIYNADLSESLFWLSTAVSDNVVVYKKYLFISILLSACYIFLVKKINKSNHKNNFKIILLVIFSILAWHAFNYSKNIYIASQFRGKLLKNFDSLQEFSVNKIKDGITAVVFIDESTTIFNMSLYGYHRKTTPNLDLLKENDSNLIVFNKALSTHTHTSVSLLEALSVSLNSEDYGELIWDRKRLSIIDALNQKGIKSTLYSNQGQTGSWNYASSVIFKNSENNFSTKSSFYGNNDDLLAKPYEEEFVDGFIDAFKNSQDKRAFFYHSYVGHGPYLKNVPINFQSEVDDFINHRNSLAIFGDRLPESLLKDVDAYDSSLRYSDFILNKVIKEIKSSEKPLVFIYFSDHGESVYTGRGHDSSKFTHEMLRVPLLMYFNDAAKSINHDDFEKYKKISLREEIIPLSKVAEIVLDVNGFSKIEGNDIPQAYVLRDTLDKGRSALVFDEYSEASIKNVSLMKDAPSDFLRLQSEVKDKEFCYHRSNSVASIRRGSLVANCLEIDVTFLSNNEPFVFHPPKNSNDLSLDYLLANVIGNDIKLWLDVKNLKKPEQCIRLKNILHANNRLSKNTFIEVQPYFYKSKDYYGDCISEIKKQGVILSQYIPNYDRKDCDDKNFCDKVRNDLEEISKSGFTDISFDYSYFDLIKNLGYSESFKLNTWGVDSDQVKKMKNFRNVILNTDDINNY